MLLRIAQQFYRAGRHISSSLICLPTLLLMLCVAATSCESTTENPPSDLSRASIDVDWSGFKKNVPAGMTLLFYNRDSGITASAIDNNISATSVNLTAGRHWAAVFNLTPEEFENIAFRGLESIETAEVCCREYTGEKWQTIPSDDNSYVACQPEWLATDTILTATVEPGEIAKSIGLLRPQNIIHTLRINLTMDNPRSIISARGAISGMAFGRKIAATAPRSNDITAIHIIDSECWSRTKQNVISAEIRCFGLPANHQQRPEENYFELQALLSDGKTVKTFIIPVGNLLTAPSATKGDNLSITLDIDIKLPPAPGNAGGMDIWFKDWDEIFNHDIPL